MNWLCWVNNTLIINMKNIIKFFKLITQRIWETIIILYAVLKEWNAWVVCMLLQFFSAIHRVYLYNYGVSGWYLKYCFRLRIKQNVIIEQNNICFNRNMLMLWCVTWPSWQRLALSLNKCPAEGFFDNQWSARAVHLLI